MTDITKAPTGQNVRKYSGTNKVSLSTLKTPTSAQPGRGIMILADISGSMGGEKMDSLKKSLTQVWRPGLSCIAFESELWELDSQDDIHTLSNTGSTHMATALEETWSRNVKHILLLTDGQPTDADESEILELAKSHAGVPIDTVGIGTRDGYGYNPNFLRELSRITGGKYNACNEPMSLPNVVEDLLFLAEKAGQEGGAIQL